ncbi:FAD-dependent oxidoreductase [Xinfangfangia sp. CPCC 101601]|uniref:FAD-dependent oxidoreductase n=1 Tax=Pseudogemmobacter lacusdianii TaxID=3069608 RepID=A0ABU0W2F4_9RHOB|nr:FAD-dependent oxidoreductase [Xinfangfangia sp. CPCC 101601]MDQ2068202.1 FAD-dependent oxidoreductase [Xinfangfangia sp. CPCC 101601]
MKTTVRRETVVIGGGLSGLYAALKLKEAGRSVAVLEARDRVGGLTLSPESEVLGRRVDLGGQWVSQHHKRIYPLVQRYSVPCVKQFATGERVCLHEDQTHRGPMGTIPGMNEADWAEYSEAFNTLYKVFDALPANPWEGELAAKLDLMTYDSWVREMLPPGMARNALLRLPGAYYGVMPEEVSALELIQKLRGCGGPRFMSDVETGGMSEHLWGSQLVSLGMAGELGKDVFLNAPALRVEWSETGVVVESDNLRVEAERAIFACAPAMINQIRFSPSLPNARRLLHQRFPNGRNSKAVVVYDRAFWRDKGLNGHVISTSGAVTAALDISGPEPTHGVMIALFSGKAALHIDPLDEAGRREAVLKVLAQALGPEALNPLEFRLQVWADEEWSAGASSPFLVPGQLTAYGPELRAPVGPLHWAGTHMATEFRGYMEGALAAGEAAAGQILSVAND